MNVSDFLHQSAAKFPDRIAFYEKGQTISYSELSSAVNDAAKILQMAGIGKKSGVGVMGQNGRGFVIMAFAVMQCGAVVMPLAAQTSNDELKGILETTRLHFILHDSTCEVDCEQCRDLNVPGMYENWKIKIHQGANHDFASHVPDAALIRFTSGTTGTSKGVILSHRTIEERTAAANRALGLDENDTVMWVLSMAYHFVVSIILYIRYGCSVIISHDFMATAMLQEINRFNATFLYVSPMHIRLLAGDASSLKMPTVNRVISTSTGISKALCDAFYQRYGVAVNQAYGIIEIGLPVINFHSATEDPDAIGYAVPGYEVEILDEHHKPVPAGHTGHLAIRGPGMFDAYLNPPRMRDEVLNGSWFMTGDMAKKRDDGLISVEGRIKSMINVAGNKVFPEEVEAVINQHPAIAMSRVSGYAHKLLGEGVRAEIVIKHPAVAIAAEELRAFCKARLSPFKVPQQIVFVDDLPMTGSGKLKR